MSTVLKRHVGSIIAPSKRPLADKQLRRDRRTAFVVVVVMIALMALLIAIGSLNSEAVHETIDYWPLMP